MHVKLLIVWRSSLCDSFSFSCNMKFHKNTKSAPFSLCGEQLSRLSGCSLRHPPHPPFPNSLNKTESITDSRVKQVQSNKPALVFETLFVSGIHPAPLLTALSGLGGGKLNSLGKRSVYIRFKQVLMSGVSWEHEFLIYCRL